jgi:hypothetical protein
VYERRGSGKVVPVQAMKDMGVWLQLLFNLDIMGMRGEL